jgi:transforming growth factor-beta-induced protein
MKSRIIIVALFVALMSLPMSASAWWWKKDRETLVDVAVAVNDQLGAFNILLDLVVADQRVFRRLDGWRHTTVFAPTDDAFIELEGVVSSLFCYDTLGDVPDWYIKDVLNYHLAGGIKKSGDVFGNDKTRMLFGGYLFPNVASETELQLVDNATLAGALPASKILLIEDVKTFDIMADNGVIHAIDRVLLPYLPPSNCE